MNRVTDDLYFGGTRLRFIKGKPLDHLSAGLYTGANAQGVMVAGLAAEIRRVAGAEVERELRSHNDLSVGEAYLTGPGQLAERGVIAIVHGVVVMSPGETATLERSTRALLTGLRLLEDAGCRSITIPLVGWRVATPDPAAAAGALGHVVISHLRRGTRLEQVLIAGTHVPYLEAIASACRRHIGVLPI